MVLKKLEEDAIPFEEKNIADDNILQELIEKGGKKQVPYLIDGSRGVAMYESADIVNYLGEHYSNKETQ